MFDHLVDSSTRPRTVKLGAHHHSAVFLIVVGVVSSVLALNIKLFFLPQPIPLQASEPKVSVALIRENTAVKMVAPLQSVSIASMDVEVKYKTAALKKLQFLLEGVYDILAIEGLTLYINNIQAGYPVTPDADGVVTYELERVYLRPGMHRVSVHISTLQDGEVVLLQSVFDPDTSFQVGDDANGSLVSMVFPYKSDEFVILEHGSLGAFVRPGVDVAAGQETATLSLYGEAEDFRLQELTFAAEQDLTGSRLDLFLNDAFITSALFDGDSAIADIDETVVRVFTGKNTHITIRGVSADEANMTLDGIHVTDVHALGLYSNAVAALNLELDLL